jgi:hypothetical protein
MAIREQRAGKTLRRAHTRRALGLVALVASLTFLPASHALAGSAIDEYLLDLPDAKGKAESPEQAPKTRLGSLPPTVVADLANDPHGKALATIATAGELGAPPPPGQGNLLNAAVEGSQPSLFGAIGSALGDPAVIGVILVLLLLGGAVVFSRIRERTANSSGGS